ncbi:MAG: hypothetical protein RQ761_05190 [Bacteroidales bacterium]|nr:hypothetical protein [Bacteroidales bacterium]
MIKHWKSSKGCYVYRILSGRANVYMINSGGAFYLIDTGRSNVREKLIKNFKTIINDEKLSALILTADSLSVIVDNEIAIVGDALFGISRRSVMPPFANDRALMVKSWHKLLETGCNIFLPGHGSEVDRILLEYSYNRYKNKF